MNVTHRTLVMLTLENGKAPFEEWRQKIKAPALSSAINARLTRLRDGNFGDHKGVGQGVFELRIPKGPGLRVYYALEKDRIVILPGGGNKRTQKRDIRNAKEIWKEYKNAS